MDRRRKLSLAFCVTVATACGSAALAGRGKDEWNSRFATLWSADHETGDLSQWYFPSRSKTGNYGGGEYNSGSALVTVSRDVAHSGKYSLKATITTPSKPTAGVRLFRWRESQDSKFLGQGLYYSAWLFFPNRYQVTGQYWNVFQFKSKRSGTIDPFWFLSIGNRPSGAMYLQLHWWSGLRLEGPHQGESGFRKYEQTVMDIPVNRWIHVECFLKQSAEFNGCIRVWQDGISLFEQTNVKTKYPGGDNQWAVANYSDGITPDPATIYFDDAAIATNRSQANTQRSFIR